MNRIIRTLAAILTTIVACVGVALVGAPAQATSRAPAHMTCEHRSHSVYYVHLGDDIDAATILDSPMWFMESECLMRGFRLIKSHADTTREANFQRRFLREDSVASKQPTIYCRTAKDRAYFLDLAFYWGSYGAKHLNHAEKTRYTHWTHTYVHNHDACRRFLPKHHH